MCHHLGEQPACQTPGYTAVAAGIARRTVCGFARRRRVIATAAARGHAHPLALQALIGAGGHGPHEDPQRHAEIHPDAGHAHVHDPGHLGPRHDERRVVEDILDKVVYGDNQDEAWFSDAKPSLDALRAEILADAELRPITGDGEDVADWNQLLAQYPGGTWLSAPWLVAEFYLYRRVAEATQWFRDGNTRGKNIEDVFAKSKQGPLRLAAARSRRWPRERLISWAMQKPQLFSLAGALGE